MPEAMATDSSEQAAMSVAISRRGTCDAVEVFSGSLLAMSTIYAEERRRGAASEGPIGGG